MEDMVVVVPVSACPAGRLHPCRQAGKSVAVRCGWDLALVRGGETTLHGIADVDADAVAGFIVTSTDTGLTLGVSASIGQPLLDGSVCDFPVPSSRSESCWMSIQVLMRMPAERASLIRASNDGRVIDVCGAGASC